MPDTPSCPRCGVVLLEPEDDSSCPACLLALALDSDETRPGIGHSLDPISDHLPALPPHYRLESRVGSGGMGLVYRAVDTRLNRPVAIKAVHDSRLLEPGANVRFRAEALAAASLDHPFICKVYELLESGRKALLVMEFVEGETLAGILRQGRPPLSRTVELISEIAEGLANAHAMGLVHRDIKPSNVMVTPHGHVKLLDFGLALPEVLSDGGATTRPTGIDGDARAGTPHYMAPEQAEGKPITARADIFSLGVVAFECIAGELPFDGATEYIYVHALIHDSPKSLAKLAPGTPKELIWLVERCLSKDPSQRPESAAAVARELRQIAETSVAPTVHTLRAASLTRSRNRWAWAAVASLAGAVAIGGLILSRRTPVDDVDARLSALVTWPSEEGESRISPDGQSVSFVSSLDGVLRLFIQPTGGGEDRQVLLPPGRIVSHVWSPDGTQLAYVLRSASGMSLHTVPLSSLENSTKRFEIPDVLNLRLVRWVDQAIYFQTDARSGGEVATTLLRRADLASGHFHEVSSTWNRVSSMLPEGLIREFDVSPDGQRVAFTLRETNQTDLWTAKMDGTLPIRLTNDPYAERRPIWLGTEDAIVYQSNRNEQIDLWEISVRDRRPWQRSASPIRELPGGASADGSIVTFDSVSEDADLWVAKPEGFFQLNAGIVSDFAPSASSDGRTVVFQRSRADNSDDVLMSTLLMRGILDGQRLTVMETAVADGFAARISPDGRQVAFMQRSTGQPQAFATLKVIDLENGNLQVLSEACPLPSFGLAPNVWTSPIVAWTSGRQDVLFVERLPVETPGSTIKRFRRGIGVEPKPLVTKADGHRIRDLFRSDDSRLLAYLTASPNPPRSNQPQSNQPSELHVLDLESRADRMLLPKVDALTALKGWTVDNRLVLLRAVSPGRPTDAELLVVDLSGQTTSITNIENMYPQTARLDARQSRLYFTRPQDRAQNLYTVSLVSGHVTKVVANNFANVTFAGVEPLPDGSALYARDERTHDIWILRRSRSGVR